MEIKKDKDGNPVEAQLVYSGQAPYQLFFGDRGYSLQTGDLTPLLPFHECMRLLRSGFFSAAGDTWTRIIASQHYSDYSHIDGLLNGQRVFIIGGGPSLKGYDLSALDNEFTICCNHSAKYYNGAKACVFVDSAFAKNEKQFLHDYKGMVFASYKCADYLPKRENTYVFPLNNSKPGATFGEGLFNGRLTGLAAINLALLLGAAEIYLLGFDMQYQGKDHHWYGSPTPQHENYREEVFHKKVSMFGAYSPWKDIIINCSESSRIDAFPKMRLEKVLGRPKKIQSGPVPKNRIKEQRAKVSSNIFPVSSPEKLARINGMLKGQRVFVLGSGPSLRGFDLSKLDGENTIAVNHTLEHYRKAKFHLFGDPSVLGYVAEIYKKYSGMVFASWHANLGDWEKTNDKVVVFAKNAVGPTVRIEDGLYSDFNSGMEAVNLALVMGASEIYLLGIDFCANNGEYYFYGRPKWFTNTVDQVDSLLKRRVQFWDLFSPYKDRIFNCSQISRIEVFEHRNIEEVLSGKCSDKTVA